MKSGSNKQKSMYSPWSIFSTRLFSKGQCRPKGVAVFGIRGPGVRTSSGKRAWASWLLKTRKASLTEADTVSWMADIWAGENTASLGTCGSKSSNSSSTTESTSDCSSSLELRVSALACSVGKLDAVVHMHLNPKVFLCAPVHSERDFWSNQGGCWR